MQGSIIFPFLKLDHALMNYNIYALYIITFKAFILLNIYRVDISDRSRKAFMAPFERIVQLLYQSTKADEL